MTIGLPRALLFYRYQYLWTTFFQELGCQVIISPDTSQAVLTEGISNSIGECCLPAKLFLGHVASLLGRCDYILVPRFHSLDRDGEFCVRLWGLPDLVRSTFPDAPLIGYDLQGLASEQRGFLRMGKLLGKSQAQTLQAYHLALRDQARQDELSRKRQQERLSSPAPKVLIVAQPYLIYDGYVGAPLVRLLEEQGGVPIFSDRCNRESSRADAKTLSSDLYWVLNQESIGAIPAMRPLVDGILLVTAFPCGTDSLANELVLRREKHLPIAQILLDEQQGMAGMQTRIECFMDILHERSCANVR